MKEIIKGEEIEISENTDSTYSLKFLSLGSDEINDELKGKIFTTSQEAFNGAKDIIDSW